MCAGPCDSEAAVLVAVDENITQVIVQAELQEAVTGACDGPSILFVMIYDQTMSHSAVPESAVMVGASTGTVLDTLNVIMIVHHLMQQCGTDFFDGTSQGTGSNVDLMGGTFLADPGVIPEGEMPITFWSALDSYSWA